MQVLFIEKHCFASIRVMTILSQTITLDTVEPTCNNIVYNNISDVAMNKYGTIHFCELSGVK